MHIFVAQTKDIMKRKEIYVVQAKDGKIVSMGLENFADAYNAWKECIDISKDKFSYYITKIEIK